MIVGRWNYEKNDYDPYVISDDWHTPTYCENMDEIVNCCSCGREVAFGDCYTSKEIHDGIGFGYPVCEKCHEEEWGRQRKARGL